MPRLNLRRFQFPLYLMLIAVFAVMFSSCSASGTVNRDMDELYSRTGVADFVSSSDFGNRKKTMFILPLTTSITMRHCESTSVGTSKSIRRMFPVVLSLNGFSLFLRVMLNTL